MLQIVEANQELQSQINSQDFNHTKMPRSVAQLH